MEETELIGKRFESSIIAFTKKIIFNVILGQLYVPSVNLRGFVLKYM